MKDKLSKAMAKKVTNVLKGALLVSANSAETLVLHQPQDPKGLEQFKKIQ